MCIECFDEVAEQVLRIAQTLLSRLLHDLVAQTCAPGGEHVVACVSEPRVAHAKHLVVLLDDHALTDRPLLVGPDHQRGPIGVGKEAFGDLRLQMHHSPGLVSLRKAQELDVAAQDLRPTEVLRQAEQGRSHGLLRPCVRAAEPREEVELEDVVQAALEVKRSDRQRLAVAGQYLLGTQVAVNQRRALVHLDLEIVVDLCQALIHARLTQGDEHAYNGRDEAGCEPDPCHGVGTDVTICPPSPWMPEYRRRSASGRNLQALPGSLWLTSVSGTFAVVGEDTLIDEELAQHFSDVAGAILDGDVVPVLGAGVNLCDRVVGQSWEFGRSLPNGSELAGMLARKFATDVTDHDLVRVSQAAVLRRGTDPLFKLLRHVFVGDFQPTSAHRFLAGLPALRARRGLDPCPQLIVTTNYDSLLERAFTEAGEPFDILYYLGEGGDGKRKHGKFLHVDAAGNQRTVETPNRYVAATIEQRTVILKIHGAAREDPAEDSWVITEDHYIDYLTRTTLSELIPVKLLEKLLDCNLLFMGYALKDWNVRVMLHRIFTQRRHGHDGWASWAVQLDPDRIDRALWKKHNVSIYAMELRGYLAQLEARLETAEVWH